MSYHQLDIMIATLMLQKKCVKITIKFLTVLKLQVGQNQMVLNFNW